MRKEETESQKIVRRAGFLRQKSGGDGDLKLEQRLGLFIEATNGLVVGDQVVDNVDLSTADGDVVLEGFRKRSAGDDVVGDVL